MDFHAHRNATLAALAAVTGEEAVLVVISIQVGCDVDLNVGVPGNFPSIRSPPQEQFRDQSAFFAVFSTRPSGLRPILAYASDWYQSPIAINSGCATKMSEANSTPTSIHHSPVDHSGTPKPKRQKVTIACDECRTKKIKVAPSYVPSANRR